MLISKDSSTQAVGDKNFPVDNYLFRVNNEDTRKTFMKILLVFSLPTWSIYVPVMW